MKVIFKYVVIDNSERGLPPRFYFQPQTINAPKEGFKEYLLSALDSDYERRTEWCDEVLAAIEQLELGTIVTYTWDGQGFQHRMTASTVTFEHTVFGECPDWPLWSCTLAQYKAALQGWRQFIGMPKSIDTELIVELPDDTFITEQATTSSSEQIVICSEYGAKK